MLGPSLEARPVQPDPALGVLGAPVVAHHPGPAVQVEQPAVEVHRAREARGGQRGQQLGPGQRRVVHERPREVVQLLLGGVEAEVPAAPRGRRPPRGRWLRRGRSARCRCAAARPRRRARPASVCLIATGGPASRSNSVQPQRARGLGAGPLVDGVADPHRLGLAGVRGLEVVALVAAVAGPQRGKAGREQVLWHGGHPIPVLERSDHVRLPRLAHHRRQQRHRRRHRPSGRRRRLARGPDRPPRGSARRPRLGAGRRRPRRRPALRRDLVRGPGERRARRRRALRPPRRVPGQRRLRGQARLPRGVGGALEGDGGHQRAGRRLLDPRGAGATSASRTPATCC